MGYRKTVNLMPGAADKMMAAAKRRKVNANRALEIAIELLDQVDHVRADAAVVGLTVQNQNDEGKPQPPQQLPMYFNR
jgi:hypothetical protein